MSQIKKNSRQKIIWAKVENTRSTLAVVIATAFGAGLFPIAPGTMGTLVGLPVAYLVHDLGATFKVIFWTLVVMIGTWAAKTFDELMQTQDNQCIVIDEFIGIGISTWTAGEQWKVWVAAFLFFRFFDILKPPPVRQVDQWSKRKSAWSSGFGVIADDLIAGIQTLGLIVFLQWLDVF